MPLIYFIRHGQTDWNAERRFQGQLDVPLNDLGRAQAARNGRALAEVIAGPAAFDFVSSPLRRAAETMEIILREMKLTADVYRTDPRLMEIHAGEWQGRLTREIFGEGMKHYGGWDFVYPGDGGESYAMLSARVLDWLTEVRADTIVTAHGGVMRCLRRHFLGLDTTEVFKLDVPQDKVLRIEDGVLSWL